MDGLAVAAGEMIGMVNGQLCAAGAGLDEVLARTLEKMGVADRELITVYYGQDITREEAEALAPRINDLYPELEIEIVAGGQPHYLYILGAE
jgi:dihydroxyacetone kinase-like predicted kinase